MANLLCIQNTEQGRLVTAYPLPPNDVKFYFTLFSKYFSSFVHTTCSLSDSRQYLAFAEVHLRVCTALSNCATCGTREGVGRGSVDLYGTIALFGGTSQNACSTDPKPPLKSKHYNSTTSDSFRRGFRSRPLSNPGHSPLPWV